MTVTAGSIVDLKGGGDLYAYEFIPGTGGSHDILTPIQHRHLHIQHGYQYPDHRQVYAIVPGLSSAPVAAYDPLYSANYAANSGPGLVGQRVYLQGGPGVPAGEYTLLPAQYATLPGGMEVVQDTSAKTVALGGSSVLLDGTVTVTGEFGGLGGALTSTPLLFDVKSKAVINAASQIALTSADAYFTSYAANNGVAAPRLPTDAAQAGAEPPWSTSPWAGPSRRAQPRGGRGSEADISSQAIDIVDQTGAAMTGVLQLTADQLTDLNADSLLIGGVRTNNADGSTSIDVTAHPDHRLQRRRPSSLRDRT